MKRENWTWDQEDQEENTRKCDVKIKDPTVDHPWNPFAEA